MRYIVYIGIILLLLTAFVQFIIIDDRPANAEKLVIVNDRVITTGEFINQYEKRDKRISDKNDFMESLITKELLIQEAQKLGIDREEKFRFEIQTYYEQSLMKLLIERKSKPDLAFVKNEKINRYIDLSDKKIDFELFLYPTLEEAKAGRHTNGNKQQTRFRYLSDNLKSAMVYLTPGDYSQPIIFKPMFTANRYLIIKVNNIVEDNSLEPITHDRKKIKAIISKYLQEQMINQWILKLREEAQVQVLNQN